MTLKGLFVGKNVQSRPPWPFFLKASLIIYLVNVSRKVKYLAVYLISLNHVKLGVISDLKIGCD